jgi:hypothetical protein
MFPREQESLREMRYLHSRHERHRRWYWYWCCRFADVSLYSVGGTAQLFDLTGHPKATRAYAWSSPIEGSDKRRFFAVLHLPPITSPVDAVRAAIVAERKGGKS